MAKHKNNLTKHASLVSLFEQRAGANNHTAVIDEQQSLNFDELNKLANQLARFILEKNSNNDSPFIGICMERSASLIVSIFAILKAGKAYVPLPPNLPEQRLNFMMKDTKLGTVITDSNHFTHEALTANNLTVINANDDTALQTYSDTNLDIAIHPNDLAYCIYTSGSTGKPKGVLIEHQGLIDRIEAIQADIPLMSSDIFLQRNNYAFDASANEILWACLTGATLAILPESATRNADKAVDFIKQHQVTVMASTPTVLNALIEAQKETPLNDIRIIISGGEVLSPNLCDLINQQLPGAELWNIYGPTEASMFICYGQATKFKNQKRIPIGKKVAGVNFHLLSKNGNISSSDNTGELCVSGSGLARGYLNNQQLTNEKFITRVINGQTTRLYRTGDNVTFLENGYVDFLGRIDFQTKINGLRIEIEEIEHHLLLHQAIDDGVLVLATRNENKQLACCYVSTSQNDIIPELKQHLTKFLPRYMVPNIWIKLDKLPTNHTGKCDRHALTNLANEYHNEILPVNTKTQEALKSIWSTILKTNNIGRNSHFFNLGGDSLSTLRLCLEIEKKLDIPIDENFIFESPTLEHIANYIDKFVHEPNALNKKETSNIRDINLERAPISQLQLLLWFSHKKTKDSFNICMGTLANIEYDIGRLREAYKATLKQYSSYWVAFSPDEPVLSYQTGSGHIIFEDISSITVENHRDKVKELCDKHLFIQFDLSQQPLIRLLAIKTTPTQTMLLVCCPHIVTDASGLQQTLHDIMFHYHHETDSATINTKETINDYLTTEFSRYSQKYLKSETVFWEKYLQDSYFMSLPQTLFKTENNNTNNILPPIALEPQLKQQLADASKQLSLPPSILFLAALAKTFSHVSGHNKIIVTLVFDYRIDQDSFHQTLPLTRMFPVYLNTDNHNHIFDYIDHVKEQYSLVIAHIDSPAILTQAALYAKRMKPFALIWKYYIRLKSKLVKLLKLKPYHSHTFEWFSFMGGIPTFLIKEPTKPDDTKADYIDIQLSLNIVDFDHKKNPELPIDHKPLTDIDLLTPPSVKNEESLTVKALRSCVYLTNEETLLSMWGGNLKEEAYKDLKKAWSKEIGLISQFLIDNHTN